MLGLALAGAIAVPLARAQSDAYQAFVQAVSLNHAATVRTWLLRGVSPNALDADKTPLLVLAAREKAFDALRALLESPLVEVDAVNPGGETALMLASLHGELDVVKLLVRRGAQVNRTGWTPLHYAALAGHQAVVEWLLENHAYIDAASPNGTTPLMMAAREKRTSIAQYLVEQGADPSLRNQAGFGAPEYFQRAGEPELARWMAQKAAEFLRRYGTQEAPVSSTGAAAATSARDPSVAPPSPASGGSATPAPVGVPAAGIPGPAAPGTGTAPNVSTPRPVAAPGPVSTPARSGGGDERPASPVFSVPVRPLPSAGAVPGGVGTAGAPRPLPGVRQ